jgi:flagellar hook-associated protein 2
MRIGGLASGMDTETIIRDLMNAQRSKMDKIMQKKQYMEWQRDDYRTINRKLNDFKNLTNDSMLRQSTFVQKTATTSSPDDVSVKNINSASNFSGTINVEQLAAKATMRSTTSIAGSPIDVNAKLTTLASFTGDQTITIKAIKADGTLQNDTEAYTFTFNPAEKSLQNVLDEINKDSNVSAFYDSHTGKISMTAKNTGDNATGNEIEISGKGEFIGFTKLSANNDAASKLNDTEGQPVGSLGKNAIFTLDGLKTQRSSNTFTVNGFELNLKKVSATSDTKITFSSATDTDKILESVTKFVDEYNKLIESLNGEIREQKYRDFQPLSTEQKAEMKEKEIELWEEKAKSGTLRNDNILSSALTKMRSRLNTTVSGVNGAGRLSSIGITLSTDRSENGKLIIDESKLRQAISEDPNQVYELFAAKGTVAMDKKTLNADNGLARHLISILDDTRKQVTEKAGAEGSTANNTFLLGNSLNNFADQITRFEDRLKMVENRLWKQFTAMEKAIQQANSQSTYLTNMFSTGS